MVIFHKTYIRLKHVHITPSSVYGVLMMRLQSLFIALIATSTILFSTNVSARVVWVLLMMTVAHMGMLVLIMSMGMYCFAQALVKIIKHSLACLTAVMLASSVNALLMAGCGIKSSLVAIWAGLVRIIFVDKQRLYE